MQLETAEQKADAIIKGLMSSGVATAVIPLPLGVPFMAVVAGGVVGIGTCYGVKLTKDEAWSLIKEFFKAAGLTFMALNVGWLFISAILTFTGAGYPVAVALDATQATAIAYAVGSSAKFYFSGQRSRKELGEMMRESFKEAKRSTPVA
jgi:uncharacterized protein (DUF697 family)